MRSASVLMLLATLCAWGWAGAQEGAFSAGVDQVVKLAAKGVGEDVVVAYVEASNVPYKLGFDEILQLNDLGVSSKVIAAMIRRGEALRQAAVQPEAAPEPAAPDPEPAKPEPAAVAPEEDPAPIYQPGALTRESLEGAPQPYQPEPASTVVIEQGYSPTTVIAPTPDRFNISFFYDSLAPYGTWVNSPPYGWIWQPTASVVDPSWRPYFHRGRWVWTDQGWYWNSSYSWGWAPFHYGRWVHHPIRRWCWVPGTVWSPAWVHWRSSHSHYGWAPLPPLAHYRPGIGFSYHGKNVSIGFHFDLGASQYNFVSAHAFLDRDLSRHRLVAADRDRFYRTTRIVKNTYVYENNRIVNRGIGRDLVAKATKRSVHPVRLNARPVIAGKTVRTSETLSKDAIEIFRPKIGQKVTEEPPAVLARRKTRLAEHNARMETARKKHAESIRLRKKHPETAIPHATRVAPPSSKQPPPSHTARPGGAVTTPKQHKTHQPNSAADHNKKTDPRPPTIPQPAKRIDTGKTRGQTKTEAEAIERAKRQRVLETQRGIVEDARHKAAEDAKRNALDDAARRKAALDAQRKAAAEEAARRKSPVGTGKPYVEPTQPTGVPVTKGTTTTKRLTRKQQAMLEAERRAAEEEARGERAIQPPGIRPGSEGPQTPKRKPTRKRSSKKKDKKEDADDD